MSAFTADIFNFAPMPSFDTYPILYWLPVYVLCWGSLWLATNGKISERTFLVAVTVLLFLLRLPSIVYNYEINPDESQMITQAMTLRQDPVYFRSVDGTTGGPLDSYFLILPGLIGLPFDYITAHLTAFGLVALSFWFLFQTTKRWFGSMAARVAFLPFVFTFGLTQNGDFLHYNSELVPLALLSGSYYLYALLLARRKPSLWHIALIGLLLGMVPFGKLQAVPLAGIVGLFVGIDILMRPEQSTSAKVVQIGALVVGSVFFPLLVVGLAKLNGVYDDFVTFYIIGNFKYANNSDPVQNLLRLPDFFKKGSEFDWLVKLTLGIWLVGLIYSLRQGNKAQTDTLKVNGFIGVLLAATLYAITRTGSEYVHYLYLLTGPLFFVLGFGWQRLGINEGRNRWATVGIMAVFLLVFGIQAGLNHRRGIAINAYPSDQQHGWAVQPSPVSKAVLTYAKPGEKLVVWGWRCDYYVQTQMPQGVAENHTIRSAFEHPLQDIYQRRYLSNFIRSFPPVFVDAVGSQNLWMTDRRTHGYEMIKPLKNFVNAHYRYVGLVNDTRIYVRTDRVETTRRDTLAFSEN
ncbi:hypothetical protein BN8_05736 [Fibrisoma limi BUZ 3]|uniref:Glycosyltransferase RgtA/B/C/D-like domain-containing protein n=2 Tax=Fibrisoma limi TaxID=663275 RepID=I2GR75_9BACT|nr:hypothetical protein BN8_05736 [Fibrisoma limi BUZ 3]